ncbi:hypothetical protein LC593_17050 [Nostoc sp. CHAB 5844]|nr:hypothetical protein [Nostoc sp. CHAB 5844]
MTDKKQLIYRRANDQQLVYHPTSEIHIEQAKTSELTKLNHQHQRFRTQLNFNNRIFELIASLSILSASLLGIGTLGFWVLELVDSNPIALIDNQYDWRTKKHICMGWMLASFCSFIGSASCGYKTNQRR